ncbi:hypothetical protein CDL15_Pgr027181 [Punica granatum]|uniref:Uncharacterized protein n=1 Tax=Punica granatum TaxID=22663 RepID=A0A218XAK8_PUNGR|nr:hypothetical protein CDL15_Pgr027181 [Punica granatum]
MSASPFLQVRSIDINHGSAGIVEREGPSGSLVRIQSPLYGAVCGKLNQRSLNQRSGWTPGAMCWQLKERGPVALRAQCQGSSPLPQQSAPAASDQPAASQHRSGKWPNRISLSSIRRMQDRLSESLPTMPLNSRDALAPRDPDDNYDEDEEEFDKDMPVLIDDLVRVTSRARATIVTVPTMQRGSSPNGSTVTPLFTPRGRSVDGMRSSGEVAPRGQRDATGAPLDESSDSPFSLEIL